MAIFPALLLEDTVQVNDKTRLDASKTFISPDESAITLIRIDPETSSSFIDVTTNQYLDWQYSGTSRTVTVTVEVTTDGAPVTFTKDIEVVTTADDKLFSNDTALLPYEPQILNWVRDGRNSFLDVHRAAQTEILNWLDMQRIWDVDGNRLTKADITDTQEVAEWSKFLTLRLIFEGLSNATDDTFADKAEKYKDMEKNARDRASLRLDLDNDGVTDKTKVNLRFSQLSRR